METFSSYFDFVKTALALPSASLALREPEKDGLK